VESLDDSASARQHNEPITECLRWQFQSASSCSGAPRGTLVICLPPFEKAVILSIDGFGDFASAAWGVGEGTTIRVDGHVYFPHSLSVFYQAITQFLRFPHYGDEYKVMGLAPYGRPTLVDAMRRIVQLRPDGTYALNLHFFRHQHARIAYRWTDGAPETSALLSPALEQLLGPRRKPEDPLDDRHRDIACSAQAMYEEAFFNLLNALHSRTGLKDLTLAGGCAMNSVANGKVRRCTPFRRLYVQSAAGDAGGAIAAAVAAVLGGYREVLADECRRQRVGGALKPIVRSIEAWRHPNLLLKLSRDQLIGVAHCDSCEIPFAHEVYS
jgi:predicted NodU family carbamoyl transferase